MLIDNDTLYCKTCNIMLITEEKFPFAKGIFFKCPVCGKEEKNTRYTDMSEVCKFS
jgi:predicted RNA-binding Zn-ribbon protein involved in translation (DUF1610 family)